MLVLVLGACNASGTDGGEADSGSGNTGDAPCAIPAFIAGDPRPIGWAAEDGGTTGGGAAAPTVVTTLDGFNAVAAGTAPAVIHVDGSLDAGTATIGSNKTIIGCSGTAALHGHVDLDRSSNVIVRNLAIIGYGCAPPDVDTGDGGECQDGTDAVTITEQANHLWLDHVAISDGSDGNLDITHGADHITISYTKFYYASPRVDPNDTGAAGHRYSSLIGHSDGNRAEDGGRLRITFHHDWWADHVVERQPRVRFGQVHLFNNLWTSTGNHYAVGVGVGANVLLENNAFIRVSTPVDSTSFIDESVAPSAVRSVGNLYAETTGDEPADLAAASVFTPPYRYPTIAAADVEADVRANAGPH